ncbi:hypothetical protein [Bdellovibrio sp. BCCA]|uniref:hypothetical protein n=1 Tax=Bdellovibrio sp. BCCA TaxID=3136281 RepID=UPI0030F3676F
MKTQMPEAVKKALVILYATLGIGLVRTFIEAPRMTQEIAPTLGGVKVMYFSLVFGFSLVAFLNWKIGQGKNWARWTCAVFFVAGLPSTVSLLIQTFKKTPFIGAFDLLQLVAQVVALVLLFQAPARGWFKKQTAI